MKDLVGALIVFISIIFSVTIVFLGVALATKKSRMEILKTLGGMDFGHNGIVRIAQLWARSFQRLFGTTLFAKRQIISVPLYTLVVSVVFFSAWLLDLYLFNNPEHVFNVLPPLSVLQAFVDFYTKGLIVAVAIDFVTIQLTKLSINVGVRRGFCSLRFALSFLLTIMVAYILFTAATYWFRWSDMNELYNALPAGEVRPNVEYSPFSDFYYALSLFQPPTIIHVTSQGWITTYFMPEPVLLYCAITGTLSLVAITLAYLFAQGVELLRRFCLGFVSSVGTPRANALSVVVFMVLGLVLLPMCLFAVYLVV